MQKYNFDNPPSRRGTSCFKWDCKPNELPMWIADMDFEAAPEIRAALQKRLDHGIFGYDDVGASAGQNRGIPARDLPRRTDWKCASSCG